MRGHFQGPISWQQLLWPSLFGFLAAFALGCSNQDAPPATQGAVEPTPVSRESPGEDDEPPSGSEETPATTDGPEGQRPTVAGPSATPVPTATPSRRPTPDLDTPLISGFVVEAEPVLQFGPAGRFAGRDFVFDLLRLDDGTELRGVRTSLNPCLPIAPRAKPGSSDPCFLIAVATGGGDTESFDAVIGPPGPQDPQRIQMLADIVLSTSTPGYLIARGTLPIEVPTEQYEACINMQNPWMRPTYFFVNPDTLVAEIVSCQLPA